MRSYARLLLLVMAVFACRPCVSAAQPSRTGEPLRASRLGHAVSIDGVVAPGEWADASRVDTWYETSPGDNVAPPVRSVGYIAFDDHAFYAAFEFDDPAPRSIRAPLADHDHISGNTTDYGGVILDTRNDGHSAVLLLASASGVQYDAVTDDDGSGEDSAPDFFWEAAARITERGWTLELRVPFSSLRYRTEEPQTWGILLYRNHPRDFRRQYFSARIPRGGNCFICRAGPLLGLEQLPSGGHVVAAPYVSASDARTAAGGPGSRLSGSGVEPEIGADVKWTPTADHALDLAVNPDFSQVESDTAQISANERFALSFAEKRPFFLEGVELLSTPTRAVYTRTITAPRWGARATGKAGAVAYTVLTAEDAGGGRAVVPGATESALVDQAAGSFVTIARAKRSIGRSFVGALVTDRELRNGQGYSRLAGPDVQWRPNEADAIAGQWLVSRTVSPDRPDLHETWDGRRVAGSALQAIWNHSTTHLDTTAGYRDLDEGFRAEAGFVPQVGYRAWNAGAGWTVRPDGFLRRQRTFLNVERQTARGGALIQQTVELGGGMDIPLGGFLQVRYLDDRVESLGRLFPRRRFGYVARFNPSRRVAQVSVDGTLGEEVDFSNGRLGRGGTINASANLNPTTHLELVLLANRRWLDVSAHAPGRRVFTAGISRLLATYAFTSRAFARVIAQYVATERDAALYTTLVDRRDGSLSGSVLLAYKINWQSVLFVGYGDDRERDDRHQTLAPTGRQVFAKLSYAFQR